MVSAKMLATLKDMKEKTKTPSRNKTKKKKGRKNKEEPNKERQIEEKHIYGIADNNLEYQFEITIISVLAKQKPNMNRVNSVITHSGCHDCTLSGQHHDLVTWSCCEIFASTQVI